MGNKRHIVVSPGDRFGRLTVIREAPANSRGYRQVELSCDCGNDKIIVLQNLLNGSTVSCGCYRREVVTTHGFSAHLLFGVWRNMLSRCYNKNVKGYKDYGGRGITVCDDWKSAGSFIPWALANGWAPNLEIDRLDNNNGYYPENCRFVTRKVNANNRRSCHYVILQENKLTLTEAVEQFGKVQYDVAERRLARGWSVEDALLVPVGKRRDNPDRGE